MASMTNLTITAPLGSQIYGDQLCVPVAWTDVLVFYLSNYVTHVGTVKSFPGERRLDSILALAAAFLMPVAGIGKGLDRLIRCACRGRTPLEKAARAGALCMVVRDIRWQPDASQELQHVSDALAIDDLSMVTGRTRNQLRRKDPMTFYGKALASCFDGPTDLALVTKSQTMRLKYHEGGSFSIRSAKMHVYQPFWQRDGSSWWDYLGIEVGSVLGSRHLLGSVQHHTKNGLVKGLPTGYQLAFLPHDAIVNTIDVDIAGAASTAIGYASADDVAGSTDLVSGMFSVAQLLFGFTTLYNAVGPQIDHFGYAAFGLTVLPYTLVSLINLLATLVTPEYASVFLIESEVMHEAVNRGAKFGGVVGRLTAREHETSKPKGQPGCTFAVCTTTQAHQQPIISAEKHHLTINITGEAQDSGKNITHQSFMVMQSTHRIMIYSALRRSARIARHRATDAEHQSEVIDEIYVPNHPNFERHKEPLRMATYKIGRLTDLMCISIGLLPLIPIGILSHFRSAQSTYAQRVIVMLWFAMGVVYGRSFAKTGPSSSLGQIFASNTLDDDDDEYRQMDRPDDSYDAKDGLHERLTAWSPRVLYIMTLMMSAAPGIAGLVVVGLMFASFGSCIQIA